MNFLLNILSFFSIAQLAEIPTQPQDPLHPGGGYYEYNFEIKKLKITGREIILYLPAGNMSNSEKFPLIVFGHGQATPVEGYSESFVHFAKKGIATAFVMYDTGFFDQNWRRMAADFNNLTATLLKDNSLPLDPNLIIYSGHSKGAYVALMAAGAPNLSHQVKSLVLFAPAGYDKEYIKNINLETPVTLIWGQADSVIKKTLMTEIFQNLSTNFKQFIEVVSYPNQSLKADHFFILNKSFLFGGQNGISAYHFYGVWKWMVSAVWDVQSNDPLKNSFLYGDQTDSTGVDSLRHIVIRNK